MNSTADRQDTRATDLLPRGRTELAVDMEAISRLSMKELRDFREVMRTIADMTAAFSSQPRFWSEENEHYLNGAGDLIAQIGELMCAYEQAAVNVAKAAKPSTLADAEWRSWTILGFAADCADDLANFAVVAAQASRDQLTAEFIERNARGSA